MLTKNHLQICTLGALSKDHHAIRSAVFGLYNIGLDQWIRWIHTHCCPFYSIK